jgi:YYY domain-containing protein
MSETLPTDSTDEPLADSLNIPTPLPVEVPASMDVLDSTETLAPLDDPALTESEVAVDALIPPEPSIPVVAAPPAWKTLSFWGGLALDIALIALIVVGVLFRFTWTNWSQGTDLHPDEYGLTGDLSIMSIPKTLGEYFNTRLSPISPYDKYDINGVKTADGPNNRFPYGQLPLTMIRLAGELTGNTDYTNIRLLGRQLSALMDTLALLVLYLIGARLYGHRVGLIAVALGALAPMEIQQSHFMTTDNFSTLFTVLSMYCAVRVAQKGRWWWYAWFGVAFGLAVACRVNLAPLAAEIIVAAAIANHKVLFNEKNDSQFTKGLGLVTGLLVISGLAAILTFRLVQPMSFRAATGDTTIFTVTPNPDFMLSLQIASAQNNGEGAGPPGEQWTNRPAIIFPLTNMVLWGLGLPLGLMAWAGLLWATWQVVRRMGWEAHLVPLSWAGGYFLFMGTRWVKSMRYFLPIYPFMALFAAWGLVELWNWVDRQQKAPRAESFFTRYATPLKVGASVLFAVVTLGSLAWAWGFTSIYRTDNTRIQASRWIYQNVAAPFDIRVRTANGDYNEPIAFSAGQTLTGDFAMPIPFTAHVDGLATQILLGHARTLFGLPQVIKISATLSVDPNGLQPLARTELVVNPSNSDPRGGTAVAQFSPVKLLKDQTYYLLLTATQGAPVSLSGDTVANEDWDEGLPLRFDGHDGFGGLYTGQTMNVRWNDDQNKRLMFATVLTQSDYVILPSQRGLWSTSRLPATYPMTIAYYKALFNGQLGFDLVASFTSPIKLGPLEISDVGGSMAWNSTPKLPLFNDNMFSAEEAFSVYDHAPVWIFKKRADFSLDKVMAVLNSVDLTTVVVMGPKEATAAPTLLMLPDDRLAEQRAGGTWADMFNPQMLLNKYEPLGVAAWWLTCILLGWLAFPITFVALPGLTDRGYALSKNLALLLLAWSSWILASFRVLPFTQGVLWLLAGVMLVVSGLIAWRRRAELTAWLKQNGRYMFRVEMFALILFVFFLLIRLGNSDLWHPSYGGEKPMDFSYFNAVLKSTSFPPYDPWFAGGYLNYYYFGFVIVGTITKMLGIVPAFAYNLILPMLFSLAGMGAFCVAYNLVAGGQRLAAQSLPTKATLQRIVANPYFAGVAAACLFVVLGNLGQWNLITSVFKRAGGDAQPWLPIQFITDWQQTALGFWRIYFQHWPIGVGTGEWYWDATRVIPDSGTVPITEFPFFTFLYADLHAHMIVLSITTLSLGWALSTVFSATEKTWRWLEFVVVWIVGGLAFGAIQPSNLSDYQTYWVLGCVAIVYGELRRRSKIDLEFFKQIGWRCVLFIGLAMAFYWPYSHWRGEGYGSVDLWKGDKTPIDAYITIHGLFLFIIFVFLLTETRRWMQRTLLDDVKDLIGPAIFALVAFGLLAFGLWWIGYSIVLIALPLILWTGLLMIRKDAEPERRAALGLIGLGLLLTVAVEVVVAKGDIGRMNTVFKFYLQVWTMLSIAGGAALAWIWAQMPEWKAISRGVWQVVLVALVTVAAMYTVLATSAKIQDRFPSRVAIQSPNVGNDCLAIPGLPLPYTEGLPVRQQPHTLNGMDYMQWSAYCDQGDFIPLKYDYDAIRWMQDNVAGSPVLVEVNAPLYHWGSRFTINTGLPGVLGWDWHERQQRVVVPDQLIYARVNDISAFYLTYIERDAVNFLRKYDVTYIVVGEYERAFYPSPSFDKFTVMLKEGLIKVAYSNPGTTIYQVTDKLSGN